jgi:hypothetical protein
MNHDSKINNKKNNVNLYYKSKYYITDSINTRCSSETLEKSYKNHQSDIYRSKYYITDSINTRCSSETLEKSYKNHQSDIYRSKYYKYKTKYLNLKGGATLASGAASNSTMIIDNSAPFKKINFSIGLNDNFNMLPDLKIDILPSEFSMNYRDFFDRKFKQKGINYIRLIEKFINPPNKITMNGIEARDILERNVSDYLPRNNSFTITLSEKVETETIVQFKAKLLEITNNDRKNLIYISLGSYLNTNDSLEQILFQQFLPQDLHSIVGGYKNIYIYLVDGGFNELHDTNQDNLVKRKDEVLALTKMTDIDGNLLIEIIDSHVVSMDEFKNELKQFVNTNNDIYVSFSGNDVQQITN